MDQKLKEKWIKALRSGKYKQGSRALRSHNIYVEDEPTYCCLGVFCEIAPGIKYEAGRYNFTTKKAVKEFGDYPADGELLSESLEKHFGMDKKVQYKGKRMSVMNKLADMNDSEDYDFNKIADYIEKVL